MLERYGVECPTQSQEIKDKIKATNREHWGSDWALGSKPIREIINQTNQEKYGSNSPSHDPKVKESIKLANLKKYGVVTASMLDETKEKMRLTNQERYGADSPSQTPEVLEEMKNTCLEKYGTEWAAQAHFSEQTRRLLNDKEWLIEQHHKLKKSAPIIASYLNVDYETVVSRLNKFNIELIHYTNASKLESEMVNFIKSMSDTTVLHNDRETTGCELDIYLPELGLAIEINGVYFHNEKFKNTDFHLSKYKKCLDKQIQLIQIFEDEWYYKNNVVKNIIANKISSLDANNPQTKNLIISKIFCDEATKFFDIWCISKNEKCEINYGLYHGDNLVASLGINRVGNRYVICQYATSQIVIGGFKALLDNFEEDYNHPPIEKVINLRWENELTYLDYGFKLVESCSPDYDWCKREKRFDRLDFDYKSLESYDPNLSEAENMHNHGFYKIYDCGKLRLVKNQRINV